MEITCSYLNLMTMASIQTLCEIEPLCLREMYTIRWIWETVEVYIEFSSNLSFTHLSIRFRWNKESYSTFITYPICIYLKARFPKIMSFVWPDRKGNSMLTYFLSPCIKQKYTGYSFQLKISWITCTVWCRYNAINFLPYHHQSTP